jgi:hypothetical protein
MTRAAKAPDQSPGVATARAELQQALATRAAQNIPATPKFAATVAGSSVPVFEWPGAAQVIYFLSRGTVTITGKQQDCKWLQFVTDGGERGWIQTSSGNVSWLSAACSEIPLGYYRPLSGVLADTFPKKGRGKLEIRNGAADAVVVLTTHDQSVQQSAYVRSGDTFTMGLIPDGNYELYSMSGIDWNGQQFMRQAVASKFADSFRFETIIEEDRRIRLGWQVTLYPVSYGDAKIIPLNLDEFPLIAVE